MDKPKYQFCVNDKTIEIKRLDKSKPDLVVTLIWSDSDNHIGGEVVTDQVSAIDLTEVILDIGIAREIIQERPLPDVAWELRKIGHKELTTVILNRSDLPQSLTARNDSDGWALE